MNGVVSRSKSSLAMALVATSVLVTRWTVDSGTPGAFRAAFTIAQFSVLPIMAALSYSVI